MCFDAKSQSDSKTVSDILPNFNLEIYDKKIEIKPEQYLMLTKNKQCFRFKEDSVNIETITLGRIFVFSIKK